MDVHRARFVPYPPSAINALAFSHTHPLDDTKDPECLRLAIGRANGNIEIWNPARGAWLQERMFGGGKDRSVEGLAWIQEPDEEDEQGKVVSGKLRLFSIGYSSSVTEWDLVTGLPARHSNGNHSEVWCFAAQPQSTSSTKNRRQSDTFLGQNLIAGCADGTLVMLSTAENELRFDKFISRPTTKKARVLSVVYKDRNIALAGFADSMIRVFDTRNGEVIRSISLGAGPPGGPKDTLVWKVKCLPSGDFVSGDSTGDVRFYNGKNFSQIQRIHGHEADILDLAVSRDGNFVFSGGMDRRTSFYSCSKKMGAGRGPSWEKWHKISHKRYHDHDVKAMATYESKSMSVIVSGGIDTQPTVAPLREFGKELSRGLPILPHSPPLISAPEARLMVSWWNSELRIWRVKNQFGVAEKPKVIARLAVKGDESITSVTITRDGGLLAAATAGGVKLFQLSSLKLETGTNIRIRKLEMPSTVGAKLVQFTPDGKWLAIITPTNHVLLARVIRSADRMDRPHTLPQLLRLRRLQKQTGRQDALNGRWGNYYRSITHVTFSTDGTILAVADLAGFVDTWVIEGHEDPTAPEVDIDKGTSSRSSADDSDSDVEEEIPEGRITFMGQRWVPNPSGHLLPRLDSAPLLLSFEPVMESKSRPQPNGNPAVHPTRHNPHPHSHDLPETEQRLLVVSAQHRLYRFEVLAGRLSDWSRRNPPSSYPPQFRMIDDRAKGCIWDVTEAYQRVWLHGETWLFMFDFSQDFPLLESTDDFRLADGMVDNGKAVSKKRKREPAKEVPRKKNSGAGDVVPGNEVPVTKVRKFKSGKFDESEEPDWIDLNTQQNTESDEDFDEEHQALTSLRRSMGQTKDAYFANGQDGISVNGEIAHDTRQEDLKSEVNLREDVLNKGPGIREAWWHTFKYRPILGIVPIGEESEPLEVVLVERPSWDLDLPPRFVGSHE
ncbi:small nucleolar ribonucleoprotein-like protein complex subunit [Zopfia rhizophila CBS 207.26]|uniref:Small nucleolar ribonucleoprotein-like protein complex subunit n=1 Tax=Zopfia rhizophila CBS 207.26 TaxID=1314779 RepID=A0A6A6EN72_9PEZI|nr:small nucleolar ribonucleoprotein-like protein complex subunit [Zopfia rhizophila CBS 207.26]